jgi:hypothetical protein
VRQFLLSTYHADGPPPPSVDMEQVMQSVAAFANELREAGAWVFASHLDPSSAATVVRVTGGETLTSDGPYIHAEEHVGGITVINAPDLDSALKWASKLSAATSLPIEVRPFMATQAGLD